MLNSNLVGLTIGGTLLLLPSDAVSFLVAFPVNTQLGDHFKIN